MKRRRGTLAIVVAAVALCATTSALGADLLPNDHKHLGVASCASSVCHGKIAPQPNRDVQLNEYTIWSRNDRHSQAFNRLKSAEALKMGAKLGIENPSGSKMCFGCHADTQAANAVGANANATVITKFKQSDGVGCEACHGGSEKWIESHAQTSTTHKDNVARGMYPTEQPLERATVCLSCHLGTRDRFATHVIMGAGHPRLSFELTTYTENQPRHYDPTSSSYIKRKGTIDGMNLWVTGQIESAERYLSLLDTDLLTPGGMIPELAFYECFSCHHRTDDLRWARTRAGPGIAPGTLRLQKQNFVMLQALASVIDPAIATELEDGTNALVRTGQSDPQTLRVSARRVQTTLKKCETWSARKYTNPEISQVRKALIRMAAEDKASDFTIAEQLFMGVDSLSYALKDQGLRQKSLDILFEKVKSGPGFSSSQFLDAVRRVQGQF
jgi:hypothetical protein